MCMHACAYVDDLLLRELNLLELGGLSRLKGVYQLGHLLIPRKELLVLFGLRVVGLGHVIRELRQPLLACTDGLLRL